MLEKITKTMYVVRAPISLTRKGEYVHSDHSDAYILKYRIGETISPEQVENTGLSAFIDGAEKESEAAQSHTPQPNKQNRKQ